MEINKLVYDRRSLTIIHNIVITLINNSDDDKMEQRSNGMNYIIF